MSLRFPSLAVLAALDLEFRIVPPGSVPGTRLLHLFQHLGLPGLYVLTIGDKEKAEHQAAPTVWFDIYQPEDLGSSLPHP